MHTTLEDNIPKEEVARTRRRGRFLILAGVHSSRVGLISLGGLIIRVFDMLEDEEVEERGDGGINLCSSLVRGVPV